MFKILAQKWKDMLENQTDVRKVFILISLLSITLLQRARRAKVILLQRLISRRIQRRRRAAFSQFLTIFACRKQQRPKSVAWGLPRPQYWFVPFQRFKHLVGRKFSSFKGNISFHLRDCWSCNPATRRVTFSSASKISFTTR